MCGFTDRRNSDGCQWAVLMDLMVAAMGMFVNVLMAEGGVRTSAYTHTV